MIRLFIISFVWISTVTQLIAQNGIPGMIKASTVQVRDIELKNTKPIKRPCLLWLPSNYSDSSTSPPHPLLIYVHNINEGGAANGRDLDRLKKNGPFHFLQNKKWNGSATYGGNCGQPGFVVFAMQANTATLIDPSELSYAIGQLLLRFRIDETRIIFTGIDRGAEIILHYVFNTKLAYQPRIIMPMSIPFTSYDMALSNVVKNGLRLWAFTFDNDRKPGIDFKSTTMKLVTNFNNSLANSAKLTVTPGTNCCWNKYYSPEFTVADNEIGDQPLNFYEWIRKNLAWPEPLPPIYQCDAYTITPYKLAGYISIGRKTKKETDPLRCSIPVYTIDGKIIKGTVLYTQRSGDNLSGNKSYFGYATSKLRGDITNRHLEVDSDGKVLSFE